MSAIGGNFAAWVADTIAHDRFVREIYRNGPVDPAICACCQTAGEAVGSGGMRGGGRAMFTRTGLCLCQSCRFALATAKRVARAQRRGTRDRHRTRSTRIAAGFCVRCGRQPARPGRRMCLDCTALNRQQQRDRYWQDAAAYLAARRERRQRALVARDPPS